MRNFLCLTAIALSGIPFGCSNLISQAVKPSPAQSLTGSLTVAAESDTSTYWAVSRKEIGVECSGSGGTTTGGYSDIDEGAQVTIKDESNKLIATGKLGKGATADIGFGGACAFPFSVTNVPTATFYTIEVGSRKGITYSAKEIQDKNWQVNISLGG